MIWSFSDSLTFARCQRHWFFGIAANGNAKKDPLRREAYLLSKLQTISAWRGQLVDEVISTMLVPAVNRGRMPTCSDCVQKARDLFEAQLNFARDHRLREVGMKPSQAGASFAAFFDVEYGIEIPDEAIDQAWTDIERALQNLFSKEVILEHLRSAGKLMAQRALIFKRGEISVKAFPDLIVIHRDKPPTIIDWKVHTFGVKDYWLQLAIYALALLRCEPHVDFPSSLSRWKETDVELLEAQLLTNTIRSHKLNDEDVIQTEKYITRSATQMELLREGRKFDRLEASDFLVTLHPETCQSCRYRKLCWKENP